MSDLNAVSAAMKENGRRTETRLCRWRIYKTRPDSFEHNLNKALVRRYKIARAWINEIQTLAVTFHLQPATFWEIGRQSVQLGIL